MPPRKTIKVSRCTLKMRRITSWLENSFFSATNTLGWVSLLTKCISLIKLAVSFVFFYLKKYKKQKRHGLTDVKNCLFQEHQNDSRWQKVTFAFEIDILVFKLVHLNAFHAFFLQSQYQALKHFLRTTNEAENDAAISMAIETVGQAKEDQLTRMLIDYLMGEEDGIPKVRNLYLEKRNDFAVSSWSRSQFWRNEENCVHEKFGEFPPIENYLCVWFAKCFDDKRLHASSLTTESKHLCSVCCRVESMPSQESVWCDQKKKQKTKQKESALTWNMKSFFRLLHILPNVHPVKVTKPCPLPLRRWKEQEMKI